MIAGSITSTSNYCPVHGSYICGCAQQSALMNHYNAMINSGLGTFGSASILADNGRGLAMVVDAKPEPNKLLLLLD